MAQAEHMCGNINIDELHKYDNVAESQAEYNIDK